jgi:hypothetical protein
LAPKVLKKIEEPVKDLTNCRFLVGSFFHLTHQLFEIFQKPTNKPKVLFVPKIFTNPKLEVGAQSMKPPNQCFS